MADKGKGKAVDDTAGASSWTSGRTETAGGGGTQQELPLGVSYQFSGAPGGGGGSGLSQTLSNQARGSAPFGGQNQIANPQFAGGGGGGGSGAGFRGFSQFADGHGGFSQFQSTLGSEAGGSGSGQNGNSQLGGGGGGGGSGGGSTPMVQPPVGNPGLGHGGFSQPAPTLGYEGFQPPVGNPAFVFGEPSTSAAASLERECTICQGATPVLWNATTVQGTRVGTPLPICLDCCRKIFAGGRPLDHLQQYLASTAVGGGGGSIPEFLAAHGHGGEYSQWAANNPAAVTSPLPWCVCCNFPAVLLWDHVPMCRACYDQSLDKMAFYECQQAQIQGEQDVDQALAQIRAETARVQQEVVKALAQGRRILIGPQRQLDHGQPSSSVAPPHAQAQGRCHRCGAPEPTRMSQAGFPVCDLCFNN